MLRKRIHLVFKTHLDIGFTDHAANVRRQYHEQFIPQAIATGEHFFAENPQAPAFIWTTGAWLIGIISTARMRRGSNGWNGPSSVASSPGMHCHSPPIPN